MDTNTHRTIRALLAGTAALLIVGSLGLPALAAVDSGGSAAGTGVSVTPRNGSIDVGETHTVTVALENPDNGVQGYNVTLAVNGSVANVTDVAFVDRPALTTVETDDDNSSVTVSGGYFNGRTGDSPLGLFEVTLQGRAEGETTLSLSVDQITDSGGDAYTVTGVTEGSMTVSRPAPEFTVASVDAPGTVTQGRPLATEVVVENSGDASGTATVALGVDGDETATATTGELQPGEQTTVSLQTATDELTVGNHSYGVRTPDDTVSGEVEVADPSTAVNVSIAPETKTVDAGDNETFTVVLDGATDGLQGATLSVNLTNGTVGSITDVSVVGSPTLQSTSISADNDSVAVEAGYASQPRAGNDALDLVTVTVEGAAAGETAVTVQVGRLTDADAADYTVTGTTPATLTVNAAGPVVPGSEGPATNADDDPLLEDVNGDGQANLFDALHYYNHRDSAVLADNPGAFDFDGDGASGTLFDALALYGELA